MNTLHVVQYSGGIGSWAATQRVIATHGTTNLVLLAADTRVEDPDLWRFVRDSTVHIGVPPTVVADGRTPFQVFRDQRFLGNSRLAPCSSLLKQRPARAWLDAHADPADTVLYVGIDCSETHRIPAIERGWAPWTVRFPMADQPYLSKQDMLDAARAAGLDPPRLYELGFSHILRRRRVCPRWTETLAAPAVGVPGPLRPSRGTRAAAPRGTRQRGHPARTPRRISRPLTLTELRRRHQATTASGSDRP